MAMVTNYSYSIGSVDVSQTSKDKNGTVILGIETLKSKFSIRATKTGHVKFYDDQGNECELVNKLACDQEINFDQDPQEG